MEQRRSMDTTHSSRTKDKYEKAVELLMSQGGVMHVLAMEMPNGVYRVYNFLRNGVLVCVDYSLVEERVVEVQSRTFLKDIVNSPICAVYAEPHFPLCTVLETKTLYFIHSNSREDTLVSYDVKNLVIHYLDV